MKKYIVDSDMLIYFLKGKRDAVEILSHIPAEDLYITRINYAELLYGAYNSQRVEENLKTIKSFLKNFKILEFTENSSEIFAKLKAKLKKQGNIIADMDLMIASIAIDKSFTLITNNKKHFNRIEKLNIYNEKLVEF